MPNQFKGLILSIVFLLPLCVSAQTEASTTEEIKNPKTGIIIEPVIIDEKLKAKDIRDYTVLITNNSGRYVNLYPIVSDVNQVAGEEAYGDIYELDKNSSLTRWIKFPRGVIELADGESISKELNLQVALNARPGRYFASISLAEGSNRNEAEAKALNGEVPRLLVNVEIEENVVEQARVVHFNTGRNVYLKYPVTFNIEMENSGNRVIEPEGSIFIYNRRGQEVANLPLSGREVAIAPGENRVLHIDWGGDKKLGKFQAKLELKYGANRTRDMQASFFFWVLPWPILSMLLGGLFLAVFILTWILFKRAHRHHLQPAARPDPQDKGRGVLDLKK